MSLRSSQVFSERQPGGSFVCSPLGSAVPGQCHCSPACGPDYNNNPLVYFRYSDCNVPCGCLEDEGDERCNCRPEREHCPPCSPPTRCQPKCPVHVQMSCCGTPTPAEWKRFHKLKRQWAREKKRKNAHRSPCVFSCQAANQHNPLLQKHCAQPADEVCAQALGIPACVGSIRPILDPDSWRISRVMTSAGTSCPVCCPECHNATVPVSLDVNFGIQYCGPSSQPYPAYDNVSGVAGYGSSISQKTRFNTPYSPDEELRSQLRRDTPFPMDEVIPNALFDDGTAVGSFRGSNRTGGDVQSHVGSYVSGGQSRHPSGVSAYQRSGYEPSMLGSRSAVPTFYSQVGSKFSDALRSSYREPEPGSILESYAGNDVRSMRGGGSVYSRAVPTELENDRSVFSTRSKRSHKSNRSRADGLSVYMDDGASRYTTRSAKSHRSQVTPQSVMEHFDDNEDQGEDMDGEPSTFTMRTNATSHHSQRSLKKSPTNKSRIDTKSRHSQKTYQAEPSVYTEIGAKGQRSQFFNDELKKKTSGKSNVNFHHTVKTGDGKSRMNFGDNGKSRINFGNNGKSRMNFANAGKSRMNFDNAGKSRMNFGENGKSRINFGDNKSRMGQMGKSVMSAAAKSRAGIFTDSESDDSSDDEQSSLVTAIQVSETLKSQGSPMSVANKSHKSRKTLRL